MRCYTTLAKPGDLRVLCEGHNSMWSRDMGLCDARIKVVEHNRAAAADARARRAARTTR